MTGSPGYLGLAMVKIKKKTIKKIGMIVLALFVIFLLIRTVPILFREKPIYETDGTLRLEGYSQPERNVILIVVDTLRADRVNAYGGRERITTPNIDELEKKLGEMI